VERRSPDVARNSPTASEESQENLQDSRRSGRDSNPVPLKLKSVALPLTRSLCKRTTFLVVNKLLLYV
jgi:hypothetical protein